MLDLGNYAIKDRTIKNQYETKVNQYIEALIRNEELQSILNSKKYLDLYRLIYESHVNIDPLTCEKSIVVSILKKEADNFLKKREQVRNLKKRCFELPTLKEIYELEKTDRVHIELMAHVVNSQIVLDKKIFCLEQQGVNIDFDKRGRYDRHKGEVKDMLRSVFYHMIGHEGKFFYGIKVRKSDFKDFDVRKFVSILNKKETEEYKIKKFTDFCAWFLYSQEFSCEIVSKKENKMPIIQVEKEDFIIRGNTFRCRNEFHEIQDVLALLDICDIDGKIITVKIPAGYCPNCKVFFILESIYKQIKEKGILLCQISDEKTYMQYRNKRQSRFASESLLMHYGYSVSEMKGLSQERRQEILAFIMDNQILTKSEIISYLEFFINQRLSVKTMKQAIMKWEEDKKFVENYCVDNMKQVKITGIYRK